MTENLSNRETIISIYMESLSDCERNVCFAKFLTVLSELMLNRGLSLDDIKDGRANDALNLELRVQGMCRVLTNEVVPWAISKLENVNI